MSHLLRRRGLRRGLLALLLLAALPLTLGFTSGRGSGSGLEHFVTSEADATNSFLSTTCDETAANAIFTLGTFTASGPFSDSGTVSTALFTGEAANGVASNQVAGTISYLGAKANAFIEFTGQLRCDSATAGRITSVIGTLRYYDTSGSGVRAYKLNAQARYSSFTLDFADQTLSSDIAGTPQAGN